MKIAFFLPNATFDMPGTREVGGIETFSFNVGAAMQRMGHDVTLFGGRPKHGRKHATTTLQLQLFDYWETSSIPDIGTRFQRLVQRLHFGWHSRHAFLNARFDMVILSKPFDWPVAAFWKKTQPSLKVVMGFHGTDFFFSDKCFYGAVDAAFADSAPVADLAEIRVGRRPAVIPNPVDLDFYRPPQHAETRQQGTPLRLVCVSRFVGWKGHAFLLDALALLQNEGFPFRCHMVGDGPEKESLISQVSQCNLGKNLSLPGHLPKEELLELYRTADAFVAPSIGMDACPIAVFEAASSGLPLVLSDQICSTHFLAKNDFLSYPARNATALAEQIKKVAALRDSSHEYSDRWARHRRMAAICSTETVVNKIIALAETD